MLVSPRNMDIDSLSTILFNDEILGVSFQQFCDVGIHRTGRLLWHRTVRMPWPRTVSPKRKQRKRKTARAKNTRLGNWERISLANSLVMALKCSPQATAFGSMNWFVYICVMSLNKKHYLHPLEISGSSEGQRKRKRKRGLRSDFYGHGLRTTQRFGARTAMQAAKEERRKRALATSPCSSPCFLCS